jgi:hypothetical protein
VVVSGIIADQKDGVIRLQSNPLDPMAQQQPQKVAADEIDERVPSRVSLMPQGLRNVLSREEILDLLAYPLRLEPEHEH